MCVFVCEVGDMGLVISTTGELQYSLLYLHGFSYPLTTLTCGEGEKPVLLDKETS